MKKKHITQKKKKRCLTLRPNELAILLVRLRYLHFEVAYVNSDMHSRLKATYTKLALLFPSYKQGNRYSEMSNLARKLIHKD